MLVATGMARYSDVSCTFMNFPHPVGLSLCQSSGSFICIQVKGVKLKTSQMLAVE